MEKVEADKRGIAVQVAAVFSIALLVLGCNSLGIQTIYNA